MSRLKNSNLAFHFKLSSPPKKRTEVPRTLYISK